MLKSAARKLALLACVALLICSPQTIAYGETPKNEIADASGIKNLLLLGRDNSSGLADVIILVSVNIEEKALTAIQIPRDTYVFLGEDSYKKINGAPSLLGGEAELCKTLGEAAGIDIDGYISFDTRLIKDAVNALGGIELFVPADMDYDDPYQGLSIHLKKGLQRLSGEEAVGFVRYRSGYVRADIGRMDAQKIFLAAAARTAVEEISGADIFPLAKLTLKYVKTNLTLSSLTSLASSVKKATTENISFVTLPGEEIQSSKSGAWFYILSKSGCEKIFSKIGSKSEFDKKHLFSDAFRSEFEEIYNREIETRIYNAAEIDGEGIDIATKN